MKFVTLNIWRIVTTRRTTIQPLYFFLSFTGKRLIYKTFTYLNDICVNIDGERGGKVSLHHTFVPLPLSWRMGNMKIHFLIFLSFSLSLCVCGIFQCKLSPHFIKRCCRVIPPQKKITCQYQHLKYRSKMIFEKIPLQQRKLTVSYRAKNYRV